jgi:hypothetical protein
MILSPLATLADLDQLVGPDEMVLHPLAAVDAGGSAPMPPAASSPVACRRHRRLRTYRSVARLGGWLETAANEMLRFGGKLRCDAVQPL